MPLLINTKAVGTQLLNVFTAIGLEENKMVSKGLSPGERSKNMGFIIACPWTSNHPISNVQHPCRECRRAAPLGTTLGVKGSVCITFYVKQNRV